MTERVYRIFALQIFDISGFSKKIQRPLRPADAGHLSQQQIEAFRICQGKARELLARMEILSRMEQPGRLTKENRNRLRSAGAVIGDTRPLKNPKERDIVVNYHVAQLLKLRKELLEALRGG